MSSFAYDYLSDQDMACPGGWYGGFKDGRITAIGTAERALSHIFDGSWTGSTFTYSFSDAPDRRYREQLAGTTDRYWVGAEQVFMVDRQTRADLGVPYTVFAGPIVDAQPRYPQGWDITLGDIVSQMLLNDEHKIPWRQIKDGIAATLTAKAKGLDEDGPEPIIYGQHRRIPDVDPASPQGFAFVPIYLGIETIDGADYHVWLVAGHACADIPDALVDGASILSDEGIQWFIPHHSGFDTMFGAPYRDVRSPTYGNDRRYTLIYGVVTDPGFLDPDVEIDEEHLSDPDACALGTRVLSVFVDGVEPIGDGSGAVITDRLAQYKHFCINYVAHAGQQSYQSGAWLTNPVWDLFDGPVGIIDEDSFDACQAIAEARFPDNGFGSPPVAGYIGAVIIGATSGDRDSVKRWLADWNRSCSTRNGITHFGQYRVVMLHPTQAIKDAAPLYTDTNEILEGSFATDIGWRDQATRVPFVGDYEHASGLWKTSGVAEAQDATKNYRRPITGRQRDYPMAPGITNLNHLAVLESRIVQHPPRIVQFEDIVVENAQGETLAYLDLGDYIRYRCADAVSTAIDDIRLAQIISHQVQAGERTVRILALDCEDYLDYDAIDAAPSATSPTNDTCATAIEFPATVAEPSFAITIDTSGHATDPSIDGDTVPEPSRAYHAAWFTTTPDVDGSLLLTTVHSLYDTLMAVLTGTCGTSPADWTLVAFNDNDGDLKTSILEIPVTGGQQYYVLIYGYGPDEGGSLTFGTTFTPS